MEFITGNVVITTRGHKGKVIDSQETLEISPEFEGLYPVEDVSDEDGDREFENELGQRQMLRENVDFGVKKIYTVQFEKNQKDFKAGALRLLNRDFVVLSIEINGEVQTHIDDKMHKRPVGNCVGSKIVYADA